MSEVKFSYATLEYKEPIVYFRVTKGIVLQEEQILECIEAGNKLCDYKPHLLLTDARVGADLSPGARKAGSAKKNTANVIAQAIVVKWLAQRLSANVFIQIDKPHYPMRVFNDEQKAVKWLLEQKANK
jgi:hypothetical protein